MEASPIPGLGLTGCGDKIEVRGFPALGLAPGSSTSDRKASEVTSKVQIGRCKASL